ncbi:Surfeit locus protein 1 [Morella rubra]|uniref:SURF1-like protein n=1 Tax=Morella rubra TaxID=262757 RepID=A0A6A1VH76_9ROSI|nr:Surfeit locus protein 1 [Morella rubra]
MAAASISRTLTRKLRESTITAGIGSSSCGRPSIPSLPRPFVPLSPQPCSSSFSTSAVSSAPESQSASSSQVHGNERRSGWSKLLLFLPGAITFGLGTWQIFRRQDKIKMLEYRQKRLEMEPLMINSISPLDREFDPLEFRRVKCRGVFDEKRSIYVGPRSRSISGITENGYYVITPLMPIPNSTERFRWIFNKSLHRREYQLGSNILKEVFQHVMLPSNQVSVPAVNITEVIGVVRESEKPSIFVPANDPTTCQWFYVDVPAIARAAGLSDNTIYIEDINENVNPSNPYPLPKDVNTLIRSSVMPQDHLNYTFTWSFYSSKCPEHFRCLFSSHVNVVEMKTVSAVEVDYEGKKT